MPQLLLKLWLTLLLKKEPAIEEEELLDLTLFHIQQVPQKHWERWFPVWKEKWQVCNSECQQSTSQWLILPSKPKSQQHTTKFLTLSRDQLKETWRECLAIHNNRLSLLTFCMTPTHQSMISWQAFPSTRTSIRLFLGMITNGDTQIVWLIWLNTSKKYLDYDRGPIILNHSSNQRLSCLDGNIIRLLSTHTF